jgi:hypothetical protein
MASLGDLHATGQRDVRTAAAGQFEVLMLTMMQVAVVLAEGFLDHRLVFVLIGMMAATGMVFTMLHVTTAGPVLAVLFMAAAGAMGVLGMVMVVLDAAAGHVMQRRAIVHVVGHPTMGVLDAVAAMGMVMNLGAVGPMLGVNDLVTMRVLDVATMGESRFFLAAVQFMILATLHRVAAIVILQAIAAGVLVLHAAGVFVDATAARQAFPVVLAHVMAAVSHLGHLSALGRAVETKVLAEMLSAELTVYVLDRHVSGLLFAADFGIPRVNLAAYLGLFTWRRIRRCPGKGRPGSSGRVNWVATTSLAARPLTSSRECKLLGRHAVTLSSRQVATMSHLRWR